MSQGLFLSWLQKCATFVGKSPAEVRRRSTMSGETWFLGCGRRGTKKSKKTLGVDVIFFPKIGVFPPKSSLSKGFSIIFTIHFGGTPK